jgi:hypothetical protein
LDFKFRFSGLGYEPVGKVQGRQGALNDLPQSRIVLLCAHV